MASLKGNYKKKIEQRLAAVAKDVLEQYKPEIISITGSVGKSSTKQALKTVLSHKFSVRANKQNYNTEWGVPLTILDEKSPERSLFNWWRLFGRAKKMAQGGAEEYPKMLVLEMGMDRPGDIAKLVDIAKPDVAVVTNVSGSHQEFFESLEAIAQEKSTLVKALSPDGIAVANADNQLARQIGQAHPGKTLLYGLSEDADIRAIDIRPVTVLPESDKRDPELDFLQRAGAPVGLGFNIVYNNESVPVVLPRVLGVTHVSAALAAAAVGLIKGMSLAQIAEALIGYEPVVGRMSLIAGIKDTAIIDDTYNASPESTMAALDALNSAGARGRKIAILGDMAELGAATEEGHRQVGIKAAEVADFAIFVGPKMQFAAGAAEEAGLVDDRQTQVQDARQVEAIIQSTLRAGDMVLIKGSRVMKMEQITKNLMATPNRAKTLLVQN